MSGVSWWAENMIIRKELIWFINTVKTMATKINSEDEKYSSMLDGQ